MQFVLKESDSEETPSSRKNVSANKSTNQTIVEGLEPPVVSDTNSEVQLQFDAAVANNSVRQAKTPNKKDSTPPPSTDVESVPKLRKSQRISTPKPKDATVMNITNKSKRLSKLSTSTVNSQQVLSKTGAQAGAVQSSPAIKKRKSRNSGVKNTSKNEKSPSSNKSHAKDKNNVSLSRPKSPSFEPILSIEDNSIPLNVNEDLNGAATTSEDEVLLGMNSLRRKSKFC